MKLKSKLMLFTAAIALSTGMASAAITVQDVIKSFNDAAYTVLEVTEGPNQIKVEAVKDGVKTEVVYDKATGDVVKQESEFAKGDNGSGGTEINQSNDDFTDTATGDNGNDNEQAGEDDSQDENANDNSDDHDEGADDNGGDDDQTGVDNSDNEDDHSGNDNEDDHDEGGNGGTSGSGNSGSGEHSGSNHDGGDHDGGDHDGGNDDNGDDD